MRLKKRHAATATVTALVLAACGSADTSDDSEDGTALEDSGSLVLGIEAPWDLAYVPTSLAVERMEEEGYDIEIVQFEDPSVMVTALDTGEITVGATSASQVLAGVDAGLDIRAVLGLTNPSFVMVADSSMTECADLAGRRVGVQGQTDLIRSMTVTWLEEDCPGTEPDFVEIPGSENRMNALLQEQIDASGIHLLRQRQLEEEFPGRFTTIEGFGAPENVTSGWFYANVSWLEEHEEIMAVFAEAYDAVIREIAEDPRIVVERAQELITDVDPDLLAEVTEIWATSDYWPAKDGISPEVVEATVAFYDEVTPFEEELTYDDVIWDVGY